MSPPRASTSVPGVYTVTNKVSGRVYVGRSAKCSHRWNQHQARLRAGTHNNPPLQNAWRKYGAGAFEFAVWVDLSGVPEAELSDRLHQAECAAAEVFPGCYNIAKIGPARISQAPQTRVLIGAKRKAAWADPISRQRTLASLREAAARPETSQRKREAQALPEVKATVLAAVRAAWRDEEKASLRVARVTTALAKPEVKAKQRDATTAGWKDPEARADRVAALNAANLRPEVMARRREGQLKRALNPEPVSEAARRAGIRAGWADPDSRARHVTALRAQAAAPEAKAKRKAAALKWWAAKRAATATSTPNAC
jgi:group I intron endonuclease